MLRFLRSGNKFKILALRELIRANKYQAEMLRLGDLNPSAVLPQMPFRFRIRSFCDATLNPAWFTMKQYTVALQNFLAGPIFQKGH